MISIFRPNSLIKQVDGALVLSVVHNSENIMRDVLEVVGGTWLFCLAPRWNDNFPPLVGDIVGHAMTALVRDRYGHNCLYENNDWL